MVEKGKAEEVVVVAEVVVAEAGEVVLEVEVEVEAEAEA